MAPPTSEASSSGASATGFGAVRQTDAGLLSVGYVDAGELPIPKAAPPGTVADL